MNAIRVLAILSLGLSLAAGVALADAAAATAAPAPLPTLTWAAQHFKDTCSSCHGVDGAHPIPLPGNPPPILAGQYRDYLVQALSEYRDGQRKNIIMAPQAQALTNAQVRALAAYISSLPTPLHTLPRPE
ncbi:MAG: c-type cytochrome [Gammaproteobacteria bacterium]